MDIIDSVFHLFFLILGIILIAGTGLFILCYKRKYPEKELDYQTSFILCLFGIFCIINAITDYINVIVSVLTIFAGLLYWYDKRKHPEKYKYLPVNVWANRLLIIFLVLFIFIIVLCLLTN